MRTSIPLRDQWRAAVLNWPPERRVAFERRLAARRAAHPEEVEAWSFVSEYRAFRADEVAAGRMLLFEAHPDLVPVGTTMAELEARDPNAYLRLKMAWHAIRVRITPNRAQLRLLEVAPGPLPRDHQPDEVS